MINKRYADRRARGQPGWADGESYAHKAAAFDHVVATFDIPRGARVLELGCGAGNLTLHAADRGYDAFGIDISENAIAWARDNAAQRNLSAQFHVCSATDLHVFEDNFFDLIFDGDCLWMVLGIDRRACFYRIFRKLKPGGLLHALAHLVRETCDQPCDFGPGAHFDPTSLTTTVGHVPQYQLSTPQGFRGEIIAAGFEILACSPATCGGSQSDAGESMPFLAGGLCIDARKPVANHR